MEHTGSLSHMYLDSEYANLGDFQFTESETEVRFPTIAAQSIGQVLAVQSIDPNTGLVSTQWQSSSVTTNVAALTDTDTVGLGVGRGEFLRYDTSVTPGKWKPFSLSRGSLITANNNNSTVELVRGSANHVLTCDGLDVVWASVSNDMLAGSIAPGKLTLARGSILRGGASGVANAHSGSSNQVLTHDGTDCAWGSVTADMLAGSIGNNKLANNTISGVLLGNNLPAHSVTVQDAKLTLTNPGLAYDGRIQVTHQIGFGSVALNDLSNLSVAAPTSGHVLKYDGANWVGGSIASAIASMGTLDMNNNKIINLADPTAATDAVNFAYVNSLVNGLTWLEAVNAVAGSNIALTSNSTPQIDGVQLAAGDRVLCINQGDAKYNGVWVIAESGGNWTRPPDYPVGGSAAMKSVYAIGKGSNQGSVYGEVGFTCTTSRTADTIAANNGAGDATTWTQFSSATFSVDNASIQQVGNQLSVKALGITSAMLAGSIANAKLVNSTISGKALGTSLDALTITQGNSITVTNSGTGFDGSATVAHTIDTIQDIRSSATPTFTGCVLNGDLSLKNGALAAGQAVFFEAQNNGTNTITLKGQASLSGDIDVVLPDTGGTLVCTAGNQTIGGTKTFTGVGVFNSTLQVKNGTTSAGYIDFFEDNDDGSNFTRLRGQALSNDIELLLPTTAGTLLVQSSTGLSVEGTSHLFSSTGGTNGDCTVRIMANTDDSTATSNPHLDFGSKGANKVHGRIQLDDRKLVLSQSGASGRDGIVLNVGTVANALSSGDVSTQVADFAAALITFSKQVVPGGTTKTLDLGSSSAEWKDFYAENGTFSNTVTTSNLTMDGNLEISDSGRLRLGTGLDLQIFHDGANSYVRDAGTGILQIGTNGTHVSVDDTANSKTLAKFITGASDSHAELYYNNELRIETTNAGVEVTGGIQVTESDSGQFGYIDCKGPSGGFVDVGIGSTDYGRLLGDATGLTLTTMPSTQLPINFKIYNIVRSKVDRLGMTVTSHQEVDGTTGLTMGLDDARDENAYFFGFPSENGTTLNSKAVHVTAGNFVTGQKYIVRVPGNTDFTAVGAANSNLNTIFTATGAGSGTGEAAPVQNYFPVLCGKTGGPTGFASTAVFGQYVTGNASHSGEYTYIAQSTTDSGAFKDFRFLRDGNFEMPSGGTAGNHSDYRLKKDFVYDFNALDLVSRLKPLKFKWIGDEIKHPDGTTEVLKPIARESDNPYDCEYGFLAHEVDQVLPSVVSGKKDQVDANGNVEAQAMYPTKLIGVLTKAIQELKAKNDALEAQMASVLTRLNVLETA